MKQLPKNILNYFATYTETRFRFDKLINYRWSNDELTLDLSLFSGFQKFIYEKIKGEVPPKVVVRKNQHTITISSKKISSLIRKELASSYNFKYLKSCIKQAQGKSKKQKLISTKNGLAKTRSTIANDEAYLEGTRTYNLAIRKMLEDVLLRLQEEKLSQIKEDLILEHLPTTIFNPRNYIQEHFDSLQEIAKTTTDENILFKKINQHFEKKITDVVIYDLFFNLQKYANFASLGSQYLFFHELYKEIEEKESVAFPLYFIEAEIKATPSEIIITIPRKLILINSPAINFFQFPSVLTTPRASSLNNARQYLAQAEIFLQTHYGYKNPFLLETLFKPILPVKEEYPIIRNRFGFQIVKNEDKRLLDYSELLNRLQLGEKSNFTDFVSNYIEGNVENNQEIVDREFHNQYPIKSPKRYISDNPLPLNDSQKRIILALQNQKNKVIVVDGPPGTGKSHTIAAISYWANQNNRSVIITSHKKAALDVIDEMLTKKFQELHPKIKPSIIRFDPSGQTINTITNTLQGSVINAAGDRTIDFNENAIKEDEENIKEEMKKKVDRKFSLTDQYSEITKQLLEFETKSKSLIDSAVLSKKYIQLPKISKGIVIDFELVENLTKKSDRALPDINIEQFQYLLKNAKYISEFLEACDQLHQIPQEIINLELEVDKIPKEFIDLVNSSVELFNTEVPIKSLSYKDIRSNLLKRITGKLPNKEKAHGIINTFKSLKYLKILKEIAKINKREKEDLTLSEIHQGIDILQKIIPLKKHKRFFKEFNGLSKKQDYSVQEIYEVVSQFQAQSKNLSLELYNFLTAINESYGHLLKKISLSFNKLSPLSKINKLTASEKELWDWIKAHYRLSKIDQQKDSLGEIASYYSIKQKEIEHLNDLRFKNLNNFIGDIARIKESFQGGKRFSEKQTKVLLENIPCIIAEPSMISKFFPMAEDSIDILVIDEASQVSIADSISLILRAKQVVVFGDEYQYGAVGAVNVSSKYASSYFKEIVDAYSEDYKAKVASGQQKKLIDIVSKEISQEEDQEAEEVMIPKDNEGSILWLKTFNIRTSTLSFAKAIANYSTSLRVHFRSFPEIIDYSNEYFYKPAQMELTVNRIRTKPIGQVLKFIHVKTKGNSGPNMNLDEIEAIVKDLKERMKNDYSGSVGIITSFREQQAKLLQILGGEFDLPKLKKKHNLEIWFVGDVQGIERDLVYYSFVEDKKFPDTSLTNIYPVIDGRADTIRSLKMQRLNVGFSRAKDTMVFVHSMPVDKYANTRLGNALKHYYKILEENLENDYFIEDESVLESEAEKKLYSLLLQTGFVKNNRKNIKIIPQFRIGDYIKAEFKKQIPKYRVDFLVTYSEGGKEQTLILEYDGVEFHTKNPGIVTKHNFSQEYLEYDVARQLELESYGYQFLRINKFTLKPEKENEQEKDVLDRLLQESFKIEA